MFGRWFYFKLATKSLIAILNPKWLHPKWKGKKSWGKPHKFSAHSCMICAFTWPVLTQPALSGFSTELLYPGFCTHAWMHSTCLKILQLLFSFYSGCGYRLKTKQLNKLYIASIIPRVLARKLNWTAHFFFSRLTERKCSHNYVIAHPSMYRSEV